MSLTLARLDIELIAPGAILPAVHCDLGEPGGGVGPVLPRTVVGDGGGVRPRVHALLPRPVVHTKVIVLHRERRHSAVDRWVIESVLDLWLHAGCRKVRPSGHQIARHKIFHEAQFW